MSVQKGHQYECLSWPYRQQLWKHKSFIISAAERKWSQMSLDVLANISPCCLALDGTGMLLNSFTNLTLSERRKHGWHLWATHISEFWYELAEMLLTSYLSWVWRYMVSAFHYAEEWTSSGDTWEGMRSGPVGSEWLESGRKTACRTNYKRSFFNISNLIKMDELVLIWLNSCCQIMEHYNNWDVWFLVLGFFLFF